MRELHIEKALDVACLEHRNIKYDFGRHLAQSDCFTVDKFSSKDGMIKEIVSGNGTRTDEVAKTRKIH